MSADFIAEVGAAFAGDTDDAASAERRRELNELARDAMLPLFEMLGELTGLPASIKAILDRHRAQVRRRIALSESDLVEIV